MTKIVHETFDRGIALEKEAQFDKAKVIYEDIFSHVTDETILKKVHFRMENIDDLIAEKVIYQRIDENAKRVLTKIGINIIENPTLMNLAYGSRCHRFRQRNGTVNPLETGLYQSLPGESTP